MSQRHRRVKDAGRRHDPAHATAGGCGRRVAYAGRPAGRPAGTGERREPRPPDPEARRHTTLNPSGRPRRPVSASRTEGPRPRCAAVMAATAQACSTADGGQLEGEAGRGRDVEAVDAQLERAGREVGRHPHPARDRVHDEVGVRPLGRPDRLVREASEAGGRFLTEVAAGLPAPLGDRGGVEVAERDGGEVRRRGGQGLLGDGTGEVVDHRDQRPAGVTDEVAQGPLAEARAVPEVVRDAGDGLTDRAGGGREVGHDGAHVGHSRRFDAGRGGAGGIEQVDAAQQAVRPATPAAIRPWPAV